MKLNDLQKVDFYQSLKQVTDLLITHDIQYLDQKNVENRIQQAIGILNFIDKLGVEDRSYRNMVVKALRNLYQRKKELQYGYQEPVTPRYHQYSMSNLVAV